MERDLDRSVSGISGEKVPAPKGHSGFDGYVYIELLRIAACFLVIVNHTNSQVFLSISPSPTWFASLIYFFVSKMAVPLFFMLSGAVLLGKDDGMRKMLGRCARMAAVLLIFSYLYWFLDFYKADMTAALDIPAFCAGLSAGR